MPENISKKMIHQKLEIYLMKNYSFYKCYPEIIEEDIELKKVLDEFSNINKEK